MIAGLVIVPVVSLFTKKPDKALVDGAFACYDKEVLVHQSTSLSDEELATGETGNLIDPEDFGEAVKKEKPKKTQKVKVPKRPGILGIAWTKIRSTALDFYDDENKEE